VIGALKRVRDYIVKNHKPVDSLPYTLEEIKAGIEIVSNVDIVEISEFNLPDNPIKGRYERYEIRCALYEPQKTKVCVQVAQSLNTCWKRFVVCKELCHSLAPNGDYHITSADQLEDLIESLISPRYLLDKLSFSPALRSENIAIFAALELLCPIHERKKVLRFRESNEISDMQVAQHFRIPASFVAAAFDRHYILFAEKELSRS